ncbi:hypothetical protein [Rhodobacter maris]|uniref:Uncharacterized protein n=1 Tax=Rhodobacter maris TaxID=446682 RepID=A0A285TB32_9RHOB|nr:hypothetical protein [Rhodobacter maris]SOC18452.1 hypothetical protein SAMN05877831_11668 [Rhodobacter maris]
MSQTEDFRDTGPEAPRLTARDVLLPIAWVTAGLALGAVALLRRNPGEEAERAAPTAPGADEDWIDSARTARAEAREKLLALYEEGRASAEAKAEIAAEMARNLAEAFREGLSEMSSETADRIAEARQRSWEEQEARRASARARNERMTRAAEETVEAVSAAVAREAARARQGAQNLVRRAGVAAQEGSEALADRVDEALDATEAALRRAARAAAPEPEEVTPPEPQTDHARKRGAKPAPKRRPKNAV